MVWYDPTWTITNYINKTISTPTQQQDRQSPCRSILEYGIASCYNNTWFDATYFNITITNSNPTFPSFLIPVPHFSSISASADPRTSRSLHPSVPMQTISLRLSAQARWSMTGRHGSYHLYDLLFRLHTRIAVIRQGVEATVTWHVVCRRNETVLLPQTSSLLRTHIHSWQYYYLRICTCINIQP